jgi:hypothetical protein
MSNNKKTGGDAFPTTEHQHTETGCYPVTRNGMTLRDHFAGLAMQVAMQVALDAVEDEDSASAMELAPKLSYAMADAMIKARDL